MILIVFYLMARIMIRRFLIKMMMVMIAMLEVSTMHTHANVCVNRKIGR